MYNHYQYRQPLSSLPIPQQQVPYFITPTHHPYHSVPPPPPPSRFYVPTQVILQQQLLQQQNHPSYRQKRQRRSLQSPINYVNRNSSLSYSGRSLSDTTTLTGVTINPIEKSSSSSGDNSPEIMTNRSKQQHKIIRVIRSSADWIVKTFCFCFKDDDIAIK